MPIKGVKNHIAKTQILPPHPHVIFFCQKLSKFLVDKGIKWTEWYGYSLKDILCIPKNKFSPNFKDIKSQDKIVSKNMV